MSYCRNAFALLLLGCGACVVQGAQPPVQAGTGLQDDGGTLSVNPNDVPVVMNCAAGQLLGKGPNGWECFTPAQPEIIQAGNGISVENNTISFNASTVPSSDVWNGTVPYAQVTGAPAPYTDAQAQAAVSWGTVEPSVKATDSWPGTVPYAQVTDAPAPYTDAQAQAAVTWSTVKGSVLPTDTWPGTVPYAQVTGAPAPYTNAQAQAAVTWSTVKPSVQTTDAWPGTVDYAHVANAPAAYTDADAQKAVTWSTVKGSVKSTDPWPGAAPYTDAQARAAVTWSSVSSSVSSNTVWPGTVAYSSLTGAPADLGTVASNVTMLQTQMNNAVSTLNTQVSSANSSIATLNSEVAALQGATIVPGEVIYASFAKVPTSPTDGERVYVSANFCHYVYNGASSRWEIMSCDFYPDWYELTSSVLSFSSPTGSSALLVSFQLTDGVVTKDYLYGADYTGSTAGTNFMLEAGSTTTDDGAAPTRLHGRWQRCGYSVGGQSVCLPYLGMLRDTAANAFETGWSRFGTTTTIGAGVKGGQASAASATTTDISLVGYSTPAASRCAVTYTASCITGGDGIGPYGAAAFPQCSPGNLGGVNPCPVPEFQGGTRGFHLQYTPNSAVCGLNQSNYWYSYSAQTCDEAR